MINLYWYLQNFFKIENIKTWYVQSVSFHSFAFLLHSDYVIQQFYEEKPLPGKLRTDARIILFAMLLPTQLRHKKLS